MSQVQEFYAGKNVFVTGGTGFLGKMLTEKLLRSCPDIGTVYLLVRAKKQKNPQERINALIDEPVFEVLRNHNPDFSKKIVGITGDLFQEGLGISNEDLDRIANEVSIIFHLAATVRFTERLDKAVTVNVNSVKCIVDIAKRCKNLKVAVHVSTAYSNCINQSINEKLYQPPLNYEEVNELVKDLEPSKWPEDEVSKLTEGVLKEWPNTYTFTKAIGEGVIGEYAKGMPFAVFRPSIVTSAYREPVPGWLSGLLGLPGIVCAVGLGVLHTILAIDAVKFDMVPVDYVCNALISSAWETGITDKWKHEEIPVYNYISGNENPVTFKQFIDNIDIFGRIYPSNLAVYYPCAVVTPSKLMHSINGFLFHFIPAIIIDSIARLFGKNLGLYGILRKAEAAISAVTYFLTHQWDFENQRVQNLWKKMGPSDKLLFPFSMRNFDWDEHTMSMIRGLRKYILGDKDGNLEQARRRNTFLYIIHVIIRLVLGFFILWIIWKLFSGDGPVVGKQRISP